MYVYINIHTHDACHINEYAYICTYMHAYSIQNLDYILRTCKYTRVHSSWIHIHIHVHIHIHIHTVTIFHSMSILCIVLPSCMHACIYIHTYIHTYTYIVYVDVRTSFMHAHIYMHTIIYKYIHAHIYIHTSK